MNGSAGFESELHDRLVALAEPAPPPPPGVVDAVRHGAMRRRRHVQMVAAAAAVLAVAGSGAVLGQLRPGPQPPPGVSAPAMNGLLGWPTRGSGAVGLDIDLIERTWPGRHTLVHVLYAGASTPERRIVVVEGRTESGAARLAVFTGDIGDWRIRLDTAGFDSPPERLFIALDNPGERSAVIAISAPSTPPVRVNNTGGQPVAFLTAGSAEQFPVPGETARRLRLYVSRSSPDFEVWNLKEHAEESAQGRRVTLLIPGSRLR